MLFLLLILPVGKGNLHEKRPEGVTAWRHGAGSTLVSRASQQKHQLPLEELRKPSTVVFMKHFQKLSAVMFLN